MTYSILQMILGHPCETPNGSTSDSMIELHRPVSIEGFRGTMALMYVVGESAERSDQGPQIHWFDLGNDDAHTLLLSSCECRTAARQFPSFPDVYCSDYVQMNPLLGRCHHMTHFSAPPSIP